MGGNQSNQATKPMFTLPENKDIMKDQNNLKKNLFVAMGKILNEGYNLILKIVGDRKDKYSIILKAFEEVLVSRYSGTKDYFETEFQNKDKWFSIPDKTVGRGGHFYDVGELFILTENLDFVELNISLFEDILNQNLWDSPEGPISPNTFLKDSNNLNYL